MELARIHSLLQPFLEDEVPSPELFEAISRYLELLLKWNARMNLTAVRDGENIVTRHFGESLFAGRKLIAREETLNAIDIGSGAGFPGLPIKMIRPQIAMELVEAHGKKAVFLREVIRELQLKDVIVRNARIEALISSPNQPKRELVTLRAVEKFADVLPAAAQLAGQGGRLALLIGEDQLVLAKQILAGKWEEPIKIPHSKQRVLAIWERHQSVSD